MKETISLLVPFHLLVALPCPRVAQTDRLSLSLCPLLVAAAHNTDEEGGTERRTTRKEGRKEGGKGGRKRGRERERERERKEGNKQARASAATDRTGREEEKRAARQQESRKEDGRVRTTTKRRRRRRETSLTEEEEEVFPSDGDGDHPEGAPPTHPPTRRRGHSSHVRSFLRRARLETASLSVFLVRPPPTPPPPRT